MNIETIALTHLHPHPANSNVMSEALLAKLMTHVAATDRYPPIIVRPLAGEDGNTYQLLDGHHRVEALRRLGREAARCVVWDVDDAEALVLLATLNRLEGKDDPHKRAALVAKLRGREELDRLAELLPERRAELDALLSLREAPPTMRAAVRQADVERMPVAVHFFLTPGDRARVERRLREIGGTREEALLALVVDGE